MDRTIMYVDMDAFFASVEQASKPWLRGRPIAVVGKGKRTVVVASSYEAKALGVKTGMTVGEVKRILPGITVVEGNNDKYTDTCVRINKILLKYSPEVEIYSIDESFVNLTGLFPLFPSPIYIARAVREEIRRTFGITCSAGIGPNRLVAKMAGEKCKPDGLMMVTKDEVEGFMKGLPVDAIPGVGKKTRVALQGLGVNTCGELAVFPAGILRRRFGIWGEYLSFMAKGIEPPGRHDPSAQPKSIGHSMTLERDVADRTTIGAYLLKLSEMVARRLRKEGLEAGGLSLTLRYPDFSTFTKRTTIDFYTRDGKAIYNTVWGLMCSMRLKDRVRLLGVSAFNLRRFLPAAPLFAEEGKDMNLHAAIDAINDTFGEHVICRASLLLCRNHHWVISPAYRPDKTYPYSH